MVTKMRMKRKRLKAAMLSIAVAAGMLLPGAASAQGLFGSGSGSSGSDGFFKETGSQQRTSGSSTSNETYGFMNDSGDFENYNTDPQVPLGSGIMVLTVLGAGYVVLKRRKK